VQLTRINAVDRARRSSSQRKDDNAAKWSLLTKAHQYAMHEALVEIMQYVRISKPSDEHEDESADQLPNYQAIQKWEHWREILEKNNRWRSECVNTLIQEINRQRDLDPKACILVFSESVYFLDVVEIALKNMHDPWTATMF